MLILAIVGGHTAALVALMLWSGPTFIVALMAPAVGLSLILALRRPWPVRLSLASRWHLGSALLGRPDCAWQPLPGPYSEHGDLADAERELDADCAADAGRIS